MARTKVLVRGVVLGVFASVLVVGLLAQPAQARDNTATVCAQLAATVQTGGGTFVSQLELVGNQAAAGDLVGANITVQQAGATLKTMAAQVRQQNNADNPQLRSLLEQLATQLDSLSAQLKDLTGLQNFNIGTLEQLGSQISGICGPTASFQPPSGSAAPGRSS
jgi:hypothetical protein